MSHKRTGLTRLGRYLTGRWPLVAPWLHSSALPIFAVLAVVVALLYGAVARWLREYERYAADAAEHARRAVARARTNRQASRARSSAMPTFTKAIRSG